MYFFCQLCNYSLLTERAEPWKLVADTRVTGSKDLVASSSASGGNSCFLFNYIARVTSRHNNQLMDQITDCWVSFPLKHNNVILITETETSPPASLLYFT